MQMNTITIKAFYLFHNDQKILALCITYLPAYGINFMDGISAANYVPGGYNYLIEDRLARIYNFYEIFLEKGRFLRMGQFHNGNDLGLYAGTCLFLCMNALRMRKKMIFYVALAFFAFLLWTNSGMRGVIYGIVFAIIVHTIVGKITVKRIFCIFITLIVGLIMVSFLPTDNLSYFFGTGASRSIETRIMLLNNGLDYLANHLIIGNGGVLENLTPLGIDPHQLPIRISVMYGLVAGVVCTILIFVLPTI